MTRAAVALLLFVGVAAARPADPEDAPPPPQGTVRGGYEYLLWWMKAGPLPPLATRNAAGRLPALDDPNTRDLFGPTADVGERSGGRFTLGLPIIRTSVDHGTAFDIAGTGAADPRSMVEALRQAAELSSRPAA